MGTSLRTPGLLLILAVLLTGLWFALMAPTGEDTRGAQVWPISEEEAAALARPTAAQSPGIDGPLERAPLAIETEPDTEPASTRPALTDAAPRMEMPVLDPAARPVSGIVRGPMGPLPGATVTVHRALHERYAEVAGYPVRSDGRSIASAKTDAAGEFQLTVREPGDYYLRAEAGDLAPGDIGPIGFDPGLGISRLQIDLGPGGSIEGRVLSIAGEHEARPLVGISRGDGLPRTKRVDRQGRFRFEDLTPGPWLVEVVREHAPRAGRGVPVVGLTATGELPWSCIVYASDVTRFDIDTAPVSLRGRLSFGGLPITGSAGLVPVDLGSRGPPSWSPITDGRFDLRARRPGSYRLEFFEWTAERVTHDLTLGEGVNHFERDIAMGTLTLIPGPLSRDDHVSIIWESEGTRFETRVQKGEATRVPAGRLRWFSLSKAGEAVNGELEVPAGDLVFLELP